MATKVKLLQRELKTVKADLAFSKERCAQLEEENRLLRDGKHDAVADEDLVTLPLTCPNDLIPVYACLRTRTVA